MKYRSDPLSRGKTPESLGYSPMVIKNLGNNPTLELLLLAMDPTRVLDLSSDLDILWTGLEQLSTTLMSHTGGWQEHTTTTAI